MQSILYKALAPAKAFIPKFLTHYITDQENNPFEEGATSASKSKTTGAKGRKKLQRGFFDL
ncbi:hypothetical protein DBT40_01005 [Aerococcus tenax]|nr:hypothetical protein DBT40_01005 [Aerococcus urinae]RAW05492.1 hypothetical protein DBT41_01000 [Aerococcus urinae]